MIICVKTLNIPQKTVTANKLKVSEYTVNMKKSVIFLYPKKEIKQTFPFTVVYIRIKYLQIMLIKGQDLTTENCKSLLRETKGLNKWRYILC